MSLPIENLSSAVRKKYIFKYKPEFSESFKIDIKEEQVTPLILEVCEQLGWVIVFRDDKSVEAKRSNDWNKFTEKITITKKASDRIEVQSKTIDGNFFDFGRNSMRTGLFIAAFQHLALEYQTSGRLDELEIEFERENNWEDYEIPSELPKPKEYGKPNLILCVIVGVIIAVSFGVFIATLSVKIAYIIGLYELIIGFGIGYFLGEVLKRTNYIDSKSIQILLVILVLLFFVTNQFVQYLLIVSENNISGISFFQFMEMRIANGLVIKELNTGWIGLVISWLVQLIFSYYLASAKVFLAIANYIIGRIPEEVITYTIYLFEKDYSESQVRDELSQKGWNKKSDQDDVFHALVEINGFQEVNRE